MITFLSIEQQLVKALCNCDACTSYSQLSTTFDAEVGTTLHHFLETSKPSKLPNENVSPDQCNKEIVALRTFFNDSKQCTDDVWFMLYRSVASLITKKKCNKRRRSDQKEEEHQNTLINSFILFSNHVLSSINNHKLRWSFLLKEKRRFEITDKVVYANSEELRRLRQNSVLALFSESAHKYYFTQFWMHYIRSLKDINLHIHVLNQLATVILPGLTNPLVVSDYLSQCFRSGGLVSILALHGLCVLMLEHQLEYPDYYKQLYSIITVHNFASRHRCELFRLLELSAKSPRLPSYIIASIIKRTLRVALLSPTPTLYFVLPFVRKLLQSHPNCLSLIHYSVDNTKLEENKKSYATILQNLAEQVELLKVKLTTTLTKGTEKSTSKLNIDLSNSLMNGVDTYNAETDDLAYSLAETSTLWELTALEKHFLPIVPLMVGAYRSHIEDKTPLQYEKTYARLFTAEITRNAELAKQSSSMESKLMANEIPSVAHNITHDVKDRLLKLEAQELVK